MGMWICKGVSGVLPEEQTPEGGIQESVEGSLAHYHY